MFEPLFTPALAPGLQQGRVGRRTGFRVEGFKFGVWSLKVWDFGSPGYMRLWGSGMAVQVLRPCDLGEMNY